MLVVVCLLFGLRGLLCVVLEFVVCCLVFGVCCVLFEVCCLKCVQFLFLVVRRVLLVVIVCCVLCVVCVSCCVIHGCSLLFVDRGLWQAVCFAWCDVRWLLCVVCCSLHCVRCVCGVCGLSFVVC